MNAKTNATKNVYADLRDRYLVNGQAIGIFRGEGPKRQLLATVPLEHWISPRPIGGNCGLKANRAAVRRAEAIAEFIGKTSLLDFVS
jgi:hypothetical protein